MRSYMAEGRAAYIAFLNLRAAYDLTPRSLVWQAMHDFGFPEWLIHKIQTVLLKVPHSSLSGSATESAPVHELVLGSLAVVDRPHTSAEIH